MDIKTVKQLADLMIEKDLTHISMSEGEKHVTISRQPQAAYPTGIIGGAEGPTAVFAANIPAQQPAPAPEATLVPEEKGEAVPSPLVGVGYMAAEPGAKPFVTVGSRVKKGQTLCIIEAMKVMNEFAAPRDGEIAAVCFEDGQLVEFGQCLFRLV